MNEQASGTRTILFTDVEGSTDFRTRVGDDAAHRVLREHEDRVREVIERHGGREVKSLGDGFMAAFVSARAAVDCAVAIQRAFEAYAEEGLRIRVGVNTGDVQEEAGDLYGQAVNAAARIAAAASGRQILVSNVVKDLAGTMPGVQFVDRGLFWLKGFPERWRLYEVLWSVRRERSAVRVPVGHRTPFVGREEEMADLRRLLDDALAGRGGLALIGGEPGLGKTRLAEEVAEEASRRGFLCLTGRCYEMEGSPPYMPLVEILQTAAQIVPANVFRESLGDAAGEVARLLPELGRLFADIPPPIEMPPEQARRYLLNSLRGFFERTSRRRPLVLVLDDLHWADESTLLLLQHTAERLHEMPALILGTYRDVELDVGRPLAKSLEWMLRHRLAHRVALRRLPETGIRAMLAALVGQDPPDALVKVIHSETEGNPFFVEEVFRHLSEEGRLLDDEGRFREDLVIDELDVPESVRLVIGRRLQRLGEDARRALSAAAVIGRNFAYEMVRQMDGLGDEELLDAFEEAERARLIVPAGSGSRYTFGHELIRQTLLSGLSLPRRQRLHLRVAEAIERSTFVAGDDAAAELAHHLFQAGAAADAGKTVRALSLAGEVAMRAMAFGDALRHFENALALEPQDHEVRWNLLHGQALALRSLGRWDAAIAAWHDALSLVEAHGDRATAGRMAYEIAHQLTWATRWPEALEVAVRGLNLLGEDVTVERAYLTLMAGLAVALNGDGVAGEGMVREGQRLADATGDERARAYSLYCQAVFHWAYYQPQACVEVARQAVQPLRASGDIWDLAALLGFLSFALFVMGRMDESAAIAHESLETSQRLGHLGAELIPGRVLSFQDFMRGDFDAFERYLDRDEEICRTIESPFIRDTYMWRGMLCHLRGRWDEARAWYERASDPTGPGLWAPVYPMWVARQLASMGAADDARRIVDAHRHFLPVPGQKPVAFSNWTTLAISVEVLLDVGDRDRAAELYPLALDYLAAGGPGQSYDFRPVDYVAALAAVAGGRDEAADGHFRRALEVSLEIGNRPAVAEILYRHGAAVLDRGDREGVDLLRRSRDEYAALGMPRHVEIVDRILAEAGA